MDKRVAELNIEHFKRMLTSETDPKKRETITQLLAEEEAKLRKINEDRKRG
jgi:ABC-type Zn uptake system ZnuABC Zn-binding protein ZnuA